MCFTFITSDAFAAKARLSPELKFCEDKENAPLSVYYEKCPLTVSEKEKRRLSLRRKAVRFQRRGLPSLNPYVAHGENYMRTEFLYSSVKYVNTIYGGDFLDYKSLSLKYSALFPYSSFFYRTTILYFNTSILNSISNRLIGISTSLPKLFLAAKKLAKDMNKELTRVHMRGLEDKASLKWKEDSIFAGAVHCSYFSTNGGNCEHLYKKRQFYVSLIGGPIILFDIRTFDNFSIGGGTLDAAFGISYRIGKLLIAFETKFYNQYFMVSSESLGLEDTAQFDTNANLHGLQFRFIVGFSPHPVVTLFGFAGFDIGFGALKGTYNDWGQIKTIDIQNNTFGFAIAFGMDFAITSFMDIGIEFPVGLTVMPLPIVRDLGGIVVRYNFFPDIYPNFNIKLYF